MGILEVSLVVRTIHVFRDICSIGLEYETVE